MRLEDLVSLNEARAARLPIAQICDWRGGTHRLVTPGVMDTDPLGPAIAARFRTGTSGIVPGQNGHDVFVRVHLPPVRLVAVGAVHITQALATMTRDLEIDLIVVDPRTAFATPDRFPGVQVFADWPEDVLPSLKLDALTGVALLSHDPKIDDPALAAALRADCFYVGALGSRKTHARRRDRLQALGFGADDIARVRAPIGLDIGAVSPSEIAISILGQIIEARRRKPLRSEEAPALARGANA